MINQKMLTGGLKNSVFYHTYEANVNTGTNIANEQRIWFSPTLPFQITTRLLSCFSKSVGMIGLSYFDVMRCYTEDGLITFMAGGQSSATNPISFS